ncbi:MAG TPA: protein kinase [Urbifossiella sp.]|nr:protein kinase [Urbifossiella sp.]
MQSQTLPPGFRIIDWLGTGQYGKVCKAHGPGGQECAFKVISLNRSSGDGLKEFRALRLIRRIKPHRHLIEYHGVWLLTSEGDLLDNADEVDDTDLTKLDVTDLLIQMPLAVKSLEARLRECQREFKKHGPQTPGDLPGIPLDELLPYVRGVAEALDHLHSPIHPLTEKGLAWIMHRDIKPANLLINTHGDVLVADYGVARAVGANVKASQTGAGTPIYIAPEQFTKKVELIDPGSDQYSFAISYYEMRTASLPFFDDVRIELNDLKRAHILGRLDFSKVPAEEQEVLKQATNRTVNKRFTSCVAFADALWKANGWTPLPVRPRSAAIAFPAPREAAAAPPPPVAPGRITKSREGSRTSLDDTAPQHPADASGTLTPGAIGTDPSPMPAPARSRPVEPALPLAEPLVEDSRAIPPWESPSASAPQPQATPWQSQAPAAPQPQANSWAAPAQAKAKGSSRSIWYFSGGLAVALLIGVGVYFGTRPAPNGDPNKQAKATQGDGNPDTGKGTQENAGNPKETETANNVKTNDFAAEWRDAQDAFSRVSDGNLGQINAGLASLEKIPAGEKHGKEARRLAQQWEAARAWLKNKTPTLDECDAIARWAAPDELSESEAAPLRRVYQKLAADNPTAAVRLQNASEAYQNGRDIPAGRKAIAQLIALKPKEPVLGAAKALLGAWDAAVAFDADLRADQDKPVRFAAISGGLDTLRTVAKNEALSSHRKDLDEFYRGRLEKLIERFAANPEELKTDAKAWASLAEKLPPAAEFPSPWLDLLRVESGFMASALAPAKSKPEALAELPTAAGTESPELAAYRKLVAAERGWIESTVPQKRRAAADALLTAAAAEPVRKQFLAPARKRAIALALAATAIEMKAKPGAIPAPDDPYTDAASIDLARRCLTQAVAFLADDAADRAARNDARLRLLQAAAFPDADAAAAKVAAFDSKSLEAALKGLPESEASAARLAFARTRDFSDPKGAQEALAIFKPLTVRILADLKKPNADLAFPVRLAGYLRAPALLKAIPTDDKPAAARELYLPLARHFFHRRDALAGDAKKLPIHLADNAAALAASAELEALAGIYALRIDGERNNADAARAIVSRDDKSPMTHAYFGLVLIHNAKTAMRATKIDSLTTGGDEIVKAVAGIPKEGDDQSMRDFLRREGSDAELELGGLLESGQQLKAAIAAYTIAIDLTEEVRARTPRGRCLFNNSATKTDSQLTTAKADLKSVPKSAADYTESRYWQLLIESYQNGLLSGDPSTNYEEGKHHLAGIIEFDRPGLVIRAGRTFTAEQLRASAATLADLPEKDRSPYGLELLEWQACLACARAHVEKDSAERADAAMAALKAFADADPLRGTLRRLQYLTCRMHLAGSLPDDLAAELWLPAEARIAAVKKLTAANRLKGEPNTPELVLFQICALHLKAQAIALLEWEKPRSFEALQAYIDELVKVTASTQIPPEKIVAELESIGSVATFLAETFKKQEKPKQEKAAEQLAVRLFTATGRLDKGAALLAAYHKEFIYRATVYRILLGRSLEAVLLKEPLDDPATIERVIAVEVLYAQGVEMLARKADLTADEKTSLAKFRKDRGVMIDDWAPHVVKASEALDKTDPAKAKQWREWKEQRLKELPISSSP